MKKAIVIKDKYNFKGPMAHSLAVSGYDLMDFNDNLMDYDLIVVFFNKAFPSLKTKENCKIAWWMNDLRKPKEIAAPAFNNHFDIIFLCHTSYIADYQKYFKCPIYFMPQHGIDNHEHFSQNPRKIDWDILFIGGSFNEQYHKFRKPILDDLSKNYRLKVIDDERTTLDQFYLYCYTPISLSMSLPKKLMTSNRTYNIISSGGCCFLFNFPGYNKLFEHEKHVIAWNSINDLKKYIDYYLANPDKILDIKLNALNLYMEKHTAKHRLDNMFAIMEGKTKEFWGFL